MRLAPLLARSLAGGVLMGLANLVPGISGGTMLLAVGIYPRFIRAVGEVTTFVFRRRSLLVLAAVAAAAAVAILALAGGVKDLVIHHRWIMYSLFIGLTLGGVPILWRLLGRRLPLPATAGAAVGLAGMAALAFAADPAGGVPTADPGRMFLAGVAGASAMILPGVSGGYLLLVLGVYVPLLAAISEFSAALTGLDVAALLELGLTVVLPVGAGVVGGIAGVSNLLRLLLERYEKATLGVLLGLLLGAVLGLWPFQQGVAPEPGETLKGQTVVEAPGGLALAESGRPLAPEDYPTEIFRPTPGQAAGSVVLVLLAFGLTVGIDHLGRNDDDTGEGTPGA